MRTVLCLLAAAAVGLTAGPAAAQVHRGVGYNPYSGRAYSNTVVRNPYTGTVHADSKTYNPYTGTSTNRTAGYNPYTGAGYKTGAAYNPYTGRYGAYGYGRTGW